MFLDFFFFLIYGFSGVIGVKDNTTFDARPSYQYMDTQIDLTQLTMGCGASRLVSQKFSFANVKTYSFVYLKLLLQLHKVPFHPMAHTFIYLSPFPYSSHPLYGSSE